MSTSLFPLGRVVITTSAKDALDPQDVQSCLTRPTTGDWGDVGCEDRKENELAVQLHRQIFSVYCDRCQIKFWIITEANRSVTTVLLPEDY